MTLATRPVVCDVEALALPIRLGLAFIRSAGDVEHGSPMATHAPIWASCEPLADRLVELVALVCSHRDVPENVLSRLMY